MSKRREDELFQLFFDHYREAMQKMPPVQILVAGKTGVGKSTLVNAVFREPVAPVGTGLPVTSSLHRYEHEELPLILFDTRGFELDARKQEEIKTEIHSLIAEKRHARETDDRIHLLWYCVNSLTNRLEPFEIEFLRELSMDLPIVLILTQTLLKNSDFEASLREMHLPVQAIIPIMAKDYPLDDLTVPAFGLEKVVSASLQLLPETIQPAFINAQGIDKEAKIEAARAAVKRYVTTAFATGFSPIPFSDATVLVPMQIAMMAQLSTIYGVSIKKKALSQVLTALAGSGLSTFAGRTIAGSLFKLIPGVGSLGGGVIAGGTAASVTYALGNAYIRLLQLLEKNQNMGSKEIKARFRDFFKEEWKLSRKIVPEFLRKERAKQEWDEVEEIMEPSVSSDRMVSSERPVPTDRVRPEDQVDPKDRVNPVTLTAPTGPSISLDPSTSAETGIPMDPSLSRDPAVLGDPTMLGNPMYPTTPSGPTDPSRPAEPSRPADPSKPIDPKAPTGPSITMEPRNSLDPMV